MLSYVMNSADQLNTLQNILQFIVSTLIILLCPSFAYFCGLFFIFDFFLVRRRFCSCQTRSGLLNCLPSFYVNILMSCLLCLSLLADKIYSKMGEG